MYTKLSLSDKIHILQVYYNLIYYISYKDLIILLYNNHAFIKAKSYNNLYNNIVQYYIFTSNVINFDVNVL